MNEEPEIREADDDDVLSRPQAEIQREAAFNAGYSWKGKTFEGLTVSKRMVCDALCYKAGLPPIKAGFDSRQWFAPMAKAIVFVCATPGKQLRKWWGLGIDVVQEEFMAWVDDNLTLRDESAILDLGERILIDSMENQAEAVPSGGNSGK